MSWHYKSNRLFLTTLMVILTAGAVQAVTIDLVPVGNAGNLDDTTGYGSVAYSYEIGKYEVTNAQWREFLNAKASVDDPYGLYNASMSGDYGGIDRNWLDDHYVYTAKGGDTNWDNRPVNWVSFWDAARFCNWLHNGQGDGDTETGAYINIGDPSTFARQSDATWCIPTENEWYKAAYHKNDGVTENYFIFPTGTDITPSNQVVDPDRGNNANFLSGGFTIGSPYYMTEVGEFENSESPYGTFDQGGNLREWNEAIIDGSSRGIRGGYWFHCASEMSVLARTSRDPAGEYGYIGFRVAHIPEPAGVVLFAGMAMIFLCRNRKRG